MSRKAARKNAFILCFQMSFFDSSELDRVLERFFSKNPADSDDTEYVNQVVRGVFENTIEIDALIQKKSENWDANRINRVDMAIMRVCIFEMLKMKEIPESVSINEAVQLAKRFGSDESPAFINGVLAAIFRELNN